VIGRAKDFQVRFLGISKDASAEYQAIATGESVPA
jgi:hypothetical protein